MSEDFGKETPRPWRTWYNGHYWQIDVEEGEYGGQSIGDVCASKFMYRNGVIDGDHGAANAALIIAAVNGYDAAQARIAELEKALREILDLPGGLYVSPMDAMKAIARATLAPEPQP